jgi:hypothetical protein
MNVIPTPVELVGRKVEDEPGREASLDSQVSLARILLAFSS